MKLSQLRGKEHAFGNAVSMSGDYCIVGAPEDGPGSAYLFRRDGSVWTFAAKLTASDASELDYFGRRVSISGGDVLVGEFWDDQNGQSAGSVYLYSGFPAQPAISVIVSLAPSSGEGSFEYEVDFANLTDSAQTFDVWIEMTGPGGRQKVGSTVEDKTLDPGQSYSESGTASLGEGAPPGDYVYSVKVGEYPDAVIASGSASYTKIALGKPGSPASEVVPDAVALLDNYPDPFNPSTTIRYNLNQDVHVTLRVYNMLGELVKTVVNDYQNRGHYEVLWDGRNESGASVASGIYMYRMTAHSTSLTTRSPRPDRVVDPLGVVDQIDGGQAGSFVQTARMLLLK